MFRYSANQRLEITLRHLRGEKAVDLSREFNIPERQIRRWKHVAVRAVEERLAGHRQLTNEASALYDARRAMKRLHAEVKDWTPDFSKLDPQTWTNLGKVRKRGGPRPEALDPTLERPTTSPTAHHPTHKPEDGEHPEK